MVATPTGQGPALTGHSPLCASPSLCRSASNALGRLARASITRSRSPKLDLPPPRVTRLSRGIVLHGIALLACCPMIETSACLRIKHRPVDLCSATTPRPPPETFVLFTPLLVFHPRLGLLVCFVFSSIPLTTGTHAPPSFFGFSSIDRPAAFYAVKSDFGRAHGHRSPGHPGLVSGSQVRFRGCHCQPSL